ncbi:MAG TPA: hypothetical protein VI386_16880 [Candidatus Sulfotelmatobacter sp.]
MRSSEDNEGFELLRKWNASGAVTRVSFVGIGGNISLSTGVVAAFDAKVLRFAGAGFELFLDMSDAAFEHVGTESIFKVAGLDAPRYTESAEILLGNGDKVIFMGAPGLDELARTN